MARTRGLMGEVARSMYPHLTKQQDEPLVLKKKGIIAVRPPRPPGWQDPYHQQRGAVSPLGGQATPATRKR
jgi:hypothetical protein